MKKLTSQKGFTLIEVVVVLAILAILAAMALPSMFGYVDASKESICEVYRQSLLRHYKYYVILHQGDEVTIPLSDFIDGKFKDSEDDVSSYKRCPTYGVYTAKEDVTAILCSKHFRVIGDDIDGEEGEGGDTLPPALPILPLFPDLEIPLVGEGWPTHESQFDEYGNYSLKAGEIFQFGDNYYVITSDYTLNKWEAGANGESIRPPSNFLNNSFIQQVTGDRWTIDDAQYGQIKDIKAGDIYVSDNGDIYLYKTVGGYGPVPPQEGLYWYKVK